MHTSSVLPLDPSAALDGSGQAHELRRLALDDPGAVAVLDQITRLGARLASAPMALIALAVEQRQLFVSQHALPQPWAGRREARLPLSLFERTLSSPAPLAIADVAAHPLVVSQQVVPEMDVAAYLGVPLVTSTGEAVGALCALDHEPREWSEGAVELLSALARSVSAELELRLESEIRQRATAAWHRSEEMYRQLVESAGDLIYRADAAGCFTYANPEAVRVTGYSEVQLVGMHFSELVRPDYRQRLAELYSAQLDHGTPATYFEFPMITRDGREVWIGQNVQLLQENGVVVGVQAVARDITEPRRVQQALRESEARFRTVVESLGEGLLITDADDVVLYVNPAVEQITGYRPDELLGRRARDIFLSPADNEEMRVRNRRRMQGVAERYELRIRHRDGEWVDMRVIASPMRDSEGRVVATLGAITDISDQKRAERALQESELRFRLVTRATDDVIWDWEMDQPRGYWNEALGRVFGYSAEETDTSMEWWRDRIHPDDRERALASIQQALDGGDSVWSGEYRFRRADGSYARVLDRGYIARDESGAPVRMSGAMMDLTARTEAETALLEANRHSQQLADRMQAVATAAAAVVAAPSLEHLHEVLREACMRVIPLDAFLLALYDPAAHALEYVGGYDAGIYDPHGSSVELAGRPAERVVREQRSLLTLRSDDPASQGALPWGRPRRSESVIRTPILAEGRVLGVISVQSYTPELYTPADVEVLETVAALAATAILNIHHLSERRAAEAALARSEQYFRSLTENAQDLIHVINADRTTRYLSPSVTRLLGFDPEEMVGRDAADMIHPDDVAGVVDAARALRGTPDSHTMELRVRHRDGSWRVFEATIRNLLDEPVVDAVVVNSRDITERKAAEADSLRLAALSLENPNPVLECDAAGEPVHANPAAEEISRALGVESVAGLLPATHAHMVQMALQHGQAFHNVEAVVGDRIFSWTYRPHVDAQVVHLFAVDITGRRLMEEQLRHDALHDALTGLPNRLLFMERLAHVIVRAKRREGSLFAVLFLDLDRFKVINDSLGHHVGDELLGVVAKRLQSCLRTEDTVARFGGDEFTILLENIGGVSDVTRVAERIQSELSEPVHLSGFDVFTSASIGIALSSSSYERPEYLLRNADMAMYRAKASGQARFEVFDRAMHAEALSRLQLETDLRRALERDEFRLAYQPVVDLVSGRVEGVEALLRWTHPDRGVLSPDAFIPVAEETGLILPIGRWVLQEACRRVADWQARFGDDAPATVGVNLSAKQFSQPDLLEQIDESLRESGLEPRALRLEITESAVMENADTAVGLLEQLKALGVRVSVDDFGTGYSSLSYLHRFPLDALKIDRSFVGQMQVEERSLQLVKTVLALARSLGVVAVAEGIETPEQLEALRRMDADYGQGYLFSRPLDPEGMEALLARAPRW